MTTTCAATFRALWLGFVVLCFSHPLRAEQFGLFTYRVVLGTTVVITGYYPRDVTGHVEIPAAIAGKPVGSIDDKAFFNCSGLTSVTIPSSVTRIGDRAFFGCTGLTSITIPTTVARIGGGNSSGGGVFSRCTGLDSIIVEPGNPEYASLGGVLFNKTQTDLIAYPGGKAGDYTIPSGVTAIGVNAFFGCTGLTNITIPSSCSFISSGAFEGCAGLTSVNIPSGVISIFDAFSGCTNLESFSVETGNPRYASIGGVLYSLNLLTLSLYPPGKAGSYAIPSGFTAIGTRAFSTCGSLTSITIPSSVTRIGEYAFFGCTGLTSIAIPSSIGSMGTHPFVGCTGLNSIMVEPGNQGYVSQEGVLFNKTQTVLIAYPGRKAGSYTIPSGVTEISKFAFNDCTGLSNVTIPASVTFIPDAFAGCTGLQAIAVNPGNSRYASSGGVLINQTETELVAYPGGRTGAYTIPASVTSIYDGAFAGCPGLTSVTIPSGVTSVHDYAFSGCTGLTSAIFSGNAPVLCDDSTFDHTSPEFTIYYLSGRTGYTSPTWNGYPARMIDTSSFPAGVWLLEHGYGHDTDLHQDPDGDGVSLLMAYALDLDPRLNLKGRMPAPILDASTLTLSLCFRATSPGITYRVETSTNLEAWASAGVIQSAPGPDGLMTASVPHDGPIRFLRLVVDD